MKKRFETFLLLLFGFVFLNLFFSTNVFGLSEAEEKDQGGKVSIIIPVYNTEKYLDECLLSAENQTYENIEMICVNDGSKDNSLKILNEHAKKDKRIKIIDQENRGLSGARNAGMKAASGEFIYFLDSDDLLLPYAMEKSVELLQKHSADVLNFDVDGVKYDEKVDLSKYFYDDDLFSTRVCKLKKGQNPFKLFKTRTITVWSFVYRRSFLVDNNVWFKEEIRVNEDILFTFLVKSCLKKMVKDKNIGYLYRYNRPNSIMNLDYKNIAKRLDSLLITFHELILNKDRCEFLGSNKYLLDYILAYLYKSIWVINDENIKKEYYKKFYEEIYINFAEKYKLKLGIMDKQILNELKDWAEIQEDEQTQN